MAVDDDGDRETGHPADGTTDGAAAGDADAADTQPPRADAPAADADAPAMVVVRTISGGTLMLRPAEFETIPGTAPGTAPGTKPGTNLGVNLGVNLGTAVGTKLGTTSGTADEVTLELPEALDIHDLVRGTTIAGHVLLGPHGVDEVGPIYVAYDARRNRRVTLRLIASPAELGAASAQARLVESLAAIARVSHPCVVAVLDVGMWTGGVYLATEFVEGIALRAWIEARDDPFPWREVLRIFREVGRGLAAAHAGSVLHRDVSPDRIVIGEGGQVRVADFGLAAALDEPIDAEARAAIDDDLAPLRESLGLGRDVVSGALVGTLEYVAPEVLAGTPADRKSDQFSMCVALYETLYGERPFVATDREGLAAEYVHGQPRPAPPESRVPTWLRRVVLRGLAIEPGDRWPSMEQLVRELDRDPAARRRRWQRGLAALTVLSAIAGVAVWQAQRSASACAPSDAAFDGVWDQARRAELEQTFVATGAPHAAQTFAATADIIDAWTDTWVEQQVAACETRRTQGAEFEEVYADRRACLDMRQGELRSLLAVLGGASRIQLDRAPLAAEALTSMRMCTGAMGLAAMRRGIEADDEQLDDLRLRVDRGWALLHLGSPTAAGAVVADVPDEVFEHPGLKVSVLRLRGAALRARGHGTEAETVLREATVEANRHGLDRLLALSWIELARTLAATPGHDVEARSVLEHAHAVIDRSRFDGERWSIAVANAEVAVSAGKPADALLHYHAALGALERSGDRPWIRAEVMTRIGELMARQGDAEAGLGYLRRAHDSIRDRLGPQHPALADVLLRIGDLRAGQHEAQDARASWDQALAIISAAHGPIARTTTMTMLAIATRLREHGDAAGALEYNRRALQSVEAGDDDPGLRAATLLDEGRTLLAVGRDRDAAEPLRQAFEIHDATWRAIAKDAAPAVRRDAATRWLEAAVLWARWLSFDPTSRARAVELARAARTVATDNGLPVEPWLVEITRRTADGVGR